MEVWTSNFLVVYSELYLKKEKLQTREWWLVSIERRDVKLSRSVIEKTIFISYLYLIIFSIILFAFLYTRCILTVVRISKVYQRGNDKRYLRGRFFLNVA